MATEEARRALESAQRYRYIEIEGTPSDCFGKATPGWLKLDVEATTEAETALVTELCSLCRAEGSHQEDSSLTAAYTPALYLRTGSTRFLVPNRLVTSFQDISSEIRP